MTPEALEAVLRADPTDAIAGLMAAELAESTGSLGAPGRPFRAGRAVRDAGEVLATTATVPVGSAMT